MAAKVRCKVFTARTGINAQIDINKFLRDDPGKEFVSATQSESHGGHFGDLNITITIWYKEE